LDKPKLLLASTNPGKLRELEDLVHGILEVVTLSHFPAFSSVEEDGDSFEANARKKAVTYARWSHCPALADDSGLCVDALKGAPGVLSARYAPGDDQARIEKLLAEMADVRSGERNATFVCALSLARPNGESQTVIGKCPGSIAFSARGSNGFGYDPIFLLDDGRTMAELSGEQKARVSHRADAFRQMMPRLLALAGRANL
jgi:XTP/dITP diphosphohydrolase